MFLLCYCILNACRALIIIQIGSEQTTLESMCTSTFNWLAVKFSASLRCTGSTGVSILTYEVNMDKW